MLNEIELKKYNRHIILKEIGEEGQLKIKNSKVLVIGAGGLGCPVLQYLTAAGTGNLGIADFDIIDESNLQRQVLYNEEDTGKLKAVVSAEKLRRQNSMINIVSYNEKISAENAERIFSHYEIIVDCTDNFSSRYLINDFCVMLGKPMVYGAVHRFQGLVSVFNLKSGNRNPPTYRCLYPKPLASESNTACSETGVLGIIPGITGMIQATEVLKIITGTGEILSGKLFLFDSLTMQTSIIEIERNPFIENFTPSTSEELRKAEYSFRCEKELKGNEITVAELIMEIRNRDNIQIVDVRNFGEQPDMKEFIDINIPLSEIEAGHEKIRRDKKVILICKSGNRSADAAEILTEKYKFSNLNNLKGGIDEWLLFKNLIK